MGSQTSSVQETRSYWDNKPHPGLRYGTRLVTSKLRWIKPGGRRVGKGQGNNFPSPAGITARAGGQTRATALPARNQLCALPEDSTDCTYLGTHLPMGSSPERKGGRCKQNIPLELQVWNSEFLALKSVNGKYQWAAGPKGILRMAPGKESG